MGADKKETEEGFLDFCKKARDSFLFCCKWLSAVLIVCWEIIRNYVLTILDHCKIKFEFNKLGQEAYAQWKKHKTFSLQSNFVKIKEFEKSIDDYNIRLKQFIEKLSVLFDFNSPETPPVSVKIEPVETVKVEPKVEKQVDKQDVVKSKPKTTKKPTVKKRTKPTVKKQTKPAVKKAAKKTPAKVAKKPRKATKKS